MRYFLYSFLLTLRQQLRSWRVYLMVLLLPVLVFSIQRFLPAQEVTAPVQVGVCLPKEGGEEFWDRLSGRSDAVTTFILADEATIRAKVATGQWDCGLVLDPDFADRLEELDTNKLISVYIGPGSAVYPLVEEAVSCTMMELMSPGIALVYAHQTGIADSLDIQALTQAQQVQVKLQTLTGQPLETQQLAQQTTAKVLHGCIALFLLVWAMFSAMDLGSWLQTDAVRRMGMVRSRGLLLCSRAAALSVAPCLSALLALPVLKAGWAVGPAVLGYLFFLSALSLLMSLWQSLREALPCLMPFVCVVSLLTSPVIFDVSALFPAVAGACKYLPMSLYLHASGGSPDSLLLLWAEGGILLVLFWLFSSGKRR